ncbi:hypothetical protein SLEP1_g54773 [Rubroshorea leprosula]|uniref:Uncharacterized protein n=1 Tax=Rubroshorea leprosula TaxID=152421 RepID=A0AAV5MEJ9_9ROSI|nr:hypothetical protein SLEP1_g54773 [Rubroshorea leprosula]
MSMRKLEHAQVKEVHPIKVIENATEKRRLTFDFYLEVGAP